MVLSKGPRFAVTPKVNATDFVAPIEATMQLSQAPPEKAEVARIKICDAILRAGKKKENIGRGERKPIKELCEDKEMKFCRKIRVMPQLFSPLKTITKKCMTF